MALARRSRQAAEARAPRAPAVARSRSPAAAVIALQKGSAMRVNVSLSMMLFGSAICAAGCTVGDEAASDDPGAGAAGQASEDPETRTGYITGADGKPIEVSYSVIDGWAYQDDIGLGPADQISPTPEGATRRSGGFSSYAMSTGQSARWPGGVLYYQLDSTLPAALKNAAVAAVNHYNAFSG